MNQKKQLVKLNRKLDEHKKATKAIEELTIKQANYIIDLIEKYLPICEWYKENRFLFTHPDITFSSSSGPLLGFADKTNELIIFNIRTNYLEKVNLSENKSELYNFNSLIKDGYFISAKTGILYLNYMLDTYLQNSLIHLDKMKRELKGIPENELVAHEFPKEGPLADRLVSEQEIMDEAAQEDINEENNDADLSDTKNDESNM